MIQTNYERVGSALGILRDGLKPFIKQKMQAQYGKTWLQRANSYLSANNSLALTPEGELLGDAYALLKVLWEQRREFNLKDPQLSLVSELRWTRNNWAHWTGGEWSSADAHRALDSIRRLLTSISASSFASKIEQQQSELLYILAEEQIYPDINNREDEIRISTEIEWYEEQLNLNEQLEIFTDRHEAQVLFGLVTARDSDQLSPYFPILVFGASGGGGKSTLINYLRMKKCYLTEGKVIFPYAHLNFTDNNTPQDLLSILVALRDQLQLHRDEQGKHLTFPRFDIAASIALSVQKGLPPIGKDQIITYLSNDRSYIDMHGQMNRYLNDYCNLFQALLLAIQGNEQFSEQKLLLQRLEKSPGWRWHLQQNSDLGIGADISRVLLHLQNSSRPPQPGRPGSNDFIKQQLPKALFADLKDAIEVFTTPKNGSKKTNAVIFLDGFEALNLPDEPDTQYLLKMLSINQYKDGETCPVLLVVGSRPNDKLDLNDDDRISSYFTFMTPQDEWKMQDRVSLLYKHWQDHLPKKKNTLLLEDLFLSLKLLDFGLDDTRSCLKQFGKKVDTQVFTDDALVQAIHEVTQGHPLYVTLIAAAVTEAENHGHSLRPEEIKAEIKRARVSELVVPGHRNDLIEPYLLQLFLRQLSDDEQAELIAYSAPRALDIATIRTIRPQLSSDYDVKKKLEHYRRLALLSKRAIDDDRLVFHSILHELLQQQLCIRSDPKSDYYQIHTRLLAHFHDLGDEQSAIEEAYHALALGISEPAVKLGEVAQRYKYTSWAQLMQAVRQAPTILMPPDVNDQANNALEHVHLHHDAESATKALVLYEWLLTKWHEDSEKTAYIQRCMGLAYLRVPVGDREKNLKSAISCLEAAQKIYTQERFPREWAMTQTDIGEVYGNLRVGDQQANLLKAIKCYRQTLEVLTQEKYPFEWATVQNNLGEIYNHLQVSVNLDEGDHKENQEDAIQYYLDEKGHKKNQEDAIQYYLNALNVRTREKYPFERAVTLNNLGNTYCNFRGQGKHEKLQEAEKCYLEALEVRTRVDLPIFWATTMNNLGNAYRNWGGEEKLQEAKKCYQHALEVRTKDKYPFEWAMTKNNLGAAYNFLAREYLRTNRDMAIKYHNLAIRYHTEALEVYTREAFPVDWAKTQSNLGNVYSRLQEGKRRKNLDTAITYYQKALEIWNRRDFPVDWAKVKNNLGNAYNYLYGEDRQVNLSRAIKCYEEAEAIFLERHMDALQGVQDKLVRSREEWSEKFERHR